MTFCFKGFPLTMDRVSMMDVSFFIFVPSLMLLAGLADVSPRFEAALVLGVPTFHQEFVLGSALCGGSPEQKHEELIAPLPVHRLRAAPQRDTPHMHPKRRTIKNPRF